MTISELIQCKTLKYKTYKRPKIRYNFTTQNWEIKTKRKWVHVNDYQEYSGGPFIRVTCSDQPTLTGH